MTTQSHTEERPTLLHVQAAVRDFLREAMPEVHRVDVTKVASLPPGDEAWEAEAVVWQPNAVLKALGLSTSHPVLDQHAYVVRLDRQLNVTGYETREAERAS